MPENSVLAEKVRLLLIGEQLNSGSLAPSAEFLRVLETGGNWATHSYQCAVESADEMSMAAPCMDEYDQAQIHLRDHLRAYVDQWVESGRQKDGTERPHVRCLSLVNRVALEQSLQNYISAELESSGEIKFGFRDPGYGTTGGNDNARAHAKHRADQLFLWFMRSEWKARFGNCRCCKKYFVAKKKLRNFYKHGVCCSECLHKATAARSTQKKRDDFRKRFIQIAAHAQNRWKPENGDKASWVAREVNDILPAGQRRTRWSVTYYQSEIDELARNLSKM